MADIATNVRRIFESMETGNLAAVDELISDDYRNHDMPTPQPGREGFKMMAKGWRAAFPDMKLKIEDVIVQGDKVCTRGVFTGTHRAEFNGIPATGKRVEVGWIDIWQAKNGRFVENWVRIDMMAMLTQLGVVPPPPGK